MTLKIETRWTPEASAEKILLRWNLDQPKGSQETEAGEKLRIKGWLLVKENSPINMVFKQGDIETDRELNSERPDVIRKILQSEPEGNPQLRCGFVYDIEMNGLPIAVGVRKAGQVHWLGHIVFKKIPKVLVGRRGNLFLDNDTNSCVEQYQGKLAIATNELRMWENYFGKMGEIARDYSLVSALLVAPGKEFVHSEDFPYERGPRTPIDELVELFGKQQRIIFPIEEMVKEWDLTYSTDDTHWTDYGALVAARTLAESFGHTFPSHIPPFELVQRFGDLGKKVVTPVKMPYFKADFTGTGVLLTFSNGVHNHGRVHRYENPAAPVGCRVLLYGDSFSTNLAPWLNLCYREVLYIHTAGSIDMQIVEKFRPDFLIAQTNTRFLIKSPAIGIDLDLLVRSKLAKMAIEELRKLKESVMARPESPWKIWTMHLIAQAEANQ